jgi:hypothetical protein
LALSAFGLVMFVAGWTIKSLALWANAFFDRFASGSVTTLTIDVCHVTRYIST